jgi:hypothetical protein
MKNKEEIVNLLIKNFRSVYCDTCKDQDSGNHCDMCHRKSMNWEIHPAFAEELADKILS